MWLTARERLTLAGLGAVALAGLGALLWQRQSLDFTRDAVPSAVEGRRTLPLAIGGAPAAHEAVQWDLALDDARRVDVNAAGIAELERLPEVGPSLARRIAAYRQAHGRFGSAEELQRVPGIGPRTYGVLKDYVRTE